MPPWQMLSSVLTTAARAGVVAVADGAAPEQPEEAPLRKLRGALQTAVHRIDRRHHARGEILQQPVIDSWCRRGLVRML